MKRRTYKVKEVARLAAVTVRTLHHYDSIGLLVPSGRSEAGYRLYSEDDLLMLQQILIGREIGLALEQIKTMLSDPDHDRRQMLLQHRQALLERVETTRAMISSVDAALEQLEGGKKMDASKLFDGFDPARYEQEARQRWGGTDPYKEAARRTKRYKEEDWKKIKAEDKALMLKLAEKLVARVNPDDESVLDLAEAHRLHIDRWYYPCSRQMHLNLAGMYVADERFTAAFDKYGDGLAVFLAAAIQANAARAI